MDPNETWSELVDAIDDLYRYPLDMDIQRFAVEALRNLADWLEKGGFPPKPVDR